MSENAQADWSNDLRRATEAAIRSLQEFAEIIMAHEEQWRIELQGQWPDSFMLLNRYVRTGIRAPYIFND